MNREDQSVVESAMGVFPSGLFLLTSAFDDKRGGMLVHDVQRCGTDPAMICVAARKGHTIDPLIRDSRAFALGVLGEENRLIRRRFERCDTPPREHPASGDEDPFDAIATRTLVTGSPIIERCTMWFDCEVARRVDLEAEMELFVGVIVGVLWDGKVAKVARQSDTV
ncbi:MAG: flavin reductase family protein [Phycisphaerales bacterium]